MPRTLPAALTTAMDSGSYEPYLRVHVKSTGGTVTTHQPKAFRLEALSATIELANFAGAPDEGWFRIERGAVINGSAVTISSVWFFITDFYFDGKFLTYKGDVFDKTYQVAPANSTYKNVIEFVAGQAADYVDPSQITYEGTAAWKNYKFYPAGKTVVVSPAKKLFTILQQKYIVFATENGWDGSADNLYFFVASQTRAVDYNVVDPLFTFNFHGETRQVIWRDEAATVHNIGPATAIIHNLGYLESTDADPIDAATPFDQGAGSKSSKLPVHLKYRTGDYVNCRDTATAPTWNLSIRIKVTEVLDTNSTPAWYQIIEHLPYFGSTEGGALPSTIEAAAPYTPLATGNFDTILSANDNNLQAAMETLDDHDHGYLAEGRLTLTTATPVPTADQTAKTTLYFTPYKGNRISLYDGVSRWIVYQFTEKSIAIPASTNTNYDVFIYNNAGVLTLELVAWTNATTRATALTTQNGVLVKSGSVTKRYLGTIRTTGTNGQTEDSRIKRFVWNYYNRVKRSLHYSNGTSSWTYATASWRQANADAGAQVEIVCGWLEDEISLKLVTSCTVSAASIYGSASIGEDSTTAPHADSHQQGGGGATAVWSPFISTLDTYPSSVGYHYYTWLERASAATVTFYAGTGADYWRGGFNGSWFC